MDRYNFQSCCGASIIVGFDGDETYEEFKRELLAQMGRADLESKGIMVAITNEYQTQTELNDRNGRRTGRTVGDVMIELGWTPHRLCVNPLHDSTLVLWSATTDRSKSRDGHTVDDLLVDLVPNFVNPQHSKDIRDENARRNPPAPAPQEQAAPAGRFQRQPAQEDEPVRRPEVVVVQPAEHIGQLDQRALLERRGWREGARVRQRNRVGAPLLTVVRINFEEGTFLFRPRNRALPDEQRNIADYVIPE